jgi:hypothetical protein
LDIDTMLRYRIVGVELLTFCNVSRGTTLS